MYINHWIWAADKAIPKLSRADVRLDSCCRWTHPRDVGPGFPLITKGSVPNSGQTLHISWV